MTCRPRKTLHLALGAALAARRPKLVRYLLSSQGPHACALVFAAWPVRQIADVLSILPRAEQAEIYLRLPSRTQTRLLQMGTFGPELATLNRRALTFGRLKIWLLQACSISGHVMARSYPQNHSGITPSPPGAVSAQP